MLCWFVELIEFCSVAHRFKRKTRLNWRQAVKRLSRRRRESAAREEN
jgi:hypothetical protein